MRKITEKVEQFLELGGMKKDIVLLLCRQNRLPLGVFRHFSGGIWRLLYAFFVS